MTATIEFSEDQLLAIKSITEWRGDWRTRKQTLTVGGYAGCGKTTLISHLVGEWDDVRVAALCGKAAYVLRNKGVENASTIHRLIYDPTKDERGRTKFILKDRLPGVGVIIIDEASMINKQLDADLRKFRLPILLFGDHGQLEPIGDNPNLMLDPEIRLEKIHRQAENNPILRLAAALREGRKIPKSWESACGRLTLGPRQTFWDIVDNYDAIDPWQFVCGYNKTRHEVNRRCREVQGYKDILEVGDIVLCLKNNYDYGIFNGMQAEVVGIDSDIEDSELDITIRTDDGEQKELTCLASQFGADQDKDHMDRDVALFDYGYCLTCHKSQGSEFDKVAVLEEVARIWDVRRWSYTAATRASEQLIYCR